MKFEHWLGQALAFAGVIAGLGALAYFAMHLLA